MKIPSYATYAGLVIIGIGGFLAGRISTPSPADAATAGSTSASSDSKDMAAGSADERAGERSSRRSERSERVQRKARDAASRSPARLEAIVRGEDALLRGRALLEFIDQLGPGDFQQAVDHFRSLGITESRFGEYAMLLSAWAKADPIAALDYAKANTGTHFATHTILSTWAANDPDAAIRWAESNHEGDGANPLMAGVIRGLAANDPQRATELLTAMPRSRERGEALDGFLPHLLAQGGNATREWIDSLSDEALRNGAMMRTASHLANTDPAGTVSWLLANPGEATDRRMDDVFSTWARQDTESAVASLATVPQGENRSDALRGVVASVAVADPKSAVAVMDRFPGDVDDRVVQNFVWHSFGNDPATAISQIQRISDNGRRERMYRRTVEAWIERDRAAASAWLQNNPLPPTVQEQINRRLNNQTGQ